MDVLNAETIRELLRYDPETGFFTWMPRHQKYFGNTSELKSWNSRWANRKALTAINGDGYCHGKIMKKTYKAHRVAWVYQTGDWPCGQIDHINGIRTDNRPENLREVDNSKNQKNSRLSRNNKSGVTGVCWAQKNQRWMAYIWANGRQNYIGFFDTIKDAAAARKESESQHNFHKNHGSTIS